MAFPQGIDFRGTGGFVTDPTNYDWNDGTISYPHTSAQGNTVGWESLPDGAADRAITSDRRLAGINYNSTASKTTNFRIDLPSSGNYNVTLGLGDDGFANDAAGAIVDSSTTLTTLSQSVTAGQFCDATNVVRTSVTDWVNNNQPYAGSFSSTIFRFKLGPKFANAAVIATLFVAAGGGGTNVTATSAAETWSGRTAALNIQTVVSATNGSETWSGKAATVAANTAITAGNGAETWAGQAATVQISGPITIAAGNATELWSGFAATVSAAGGVVQRNRVFRAKKHVIYGSS